MANSTSLALLPPTPEQAQVLRVFCEEGNLDWMGDIERFRRIMLKLDACIKDIQQAAMSKVLSEQGHETGAAGKFAGTDMMYASNAQPSTAGSQEAHDLLIEELSRKHSEEIRELESKLSHMQVVSIQEMQSAQKSKTDLLAKMNQLQNEVDAASRKNLDLTKKVLELEEKLCDAASDILHLDAQHKEQVAALERELEKSKHAVSDSERKQLESANAAASAIEQLKAEISKARLGLQAAELETIKHSECKDSLAECSSQLKVVNTRLLMQQEQQAALEELHQQQLLELRNKLSDLHHKLDEKNKELRMAFSNTSELQREFNLHRLKLEGEVEKLKHALARTADDKELLVYVSMTQDSILDLQHHLDSSSQGSDDKSNRWFRGQLVALVGELRQWAEHILKQPQMASLTSAHPISKKRLMELQLQLLKALKSAVVDAVATTFHIEGLEQQLEKLRVDRCQADGLQLELQAATQEAVIHKRAANDLKQELQKQQEHLQLAEVELDQHRRQVEEMQYVIKELDEKLALGETAHHHQLVQVQQDVQEQIQIVVDAYHQELAVITAQLSDSSFQVSDQRVPNHAKSSGLDENSSRKVFHVDHVPCDGSQLQYSLDSCLAVKGLCSESSRNDLLEAGATPADHTQLLQEAYVHLSKLQQKYKALKHSYIKQCLRRHAIDEALLQRVGSLGSNQVQCTGSTRGTSLKSTMSDSTIPIPCRSGGQPACKEEEQGMRHATAGRPSGKGSNPSVPAQRLKHGPHEKVASASNLRSLSRSRRTPGKPSKGTVKPTWDQSLPGS